MQVLVIVAALPKTPQARHIAKQLTRSATAPGAHYDEARSAESRADFVHKVKIACKEMRESHYWLRLIQRARLLSKLDVSPTIDEARQLAALLTASANTASHNQTKGPKRKTAQ